eukprot:TRINITY_DN22762_c0_g1_i1.p2 TRINITY_DN22762_c0_g1~~TRINITY_DN22762_c0_g1_i1.p2  ORF type:complete len:330 (-),score=82.10 TRINITY_DN22762_c0_g1_i1:1681-2637(-)
MKFILLGCLGYLVRCVFAQSCEPTLQTGPGPLFKFDQAEKNTICEYNPAHQSYYKGIASSCYGGLCLLREKVAPANGIRLFLNGTVRSTDCRPVPGAVIDLWQTDVNGVYGSMHPHEEDGYCRGRVRADANGAFAVDTEIPGLYGLTSGATELFDLPPFAPQHIHAIVTAPGHAVLMTQIYFADDPVGAFDFRAVLGGRDLGANHTEAQARFAACTQNGVAGNCATFDFVLAPTAAETSGSVDERILAAICAPGAFPEVFVTCNPDKIWMLRWRYVLPALAIVVSVLLAALVAVVRVLRRLVFGSPAKRAADARKKRE